jgi:hypothetical protein
MMQPARQQTPVPPEWMRAMDRALEGAWPRPDQRPPPFGIWLDDGHPGAKQIERAERVQPVQRVERARVLATAGPALLSLAAVALWAVGVGRVNLREVNDLGLASVLPLPVLAAPLIATAGFVWTLSQRPLRRSMLLLHVVALVVMLYGMNAMVEPVPGPNIVWRHAGIADHIARTGAIDPTIDAYFNWPGFFTLAAFLSSAAGLNSIASLAAWAPVFFNLLYLGPLLLLFRRVTSDRRLIWLAVWLFYATNWIHQDYLAPQALSYFLYLLILGILVGWFGTDRLVVRFARARLLPRWPRAAATPMPLRSVSLDAERPQEGPFQRAGLMVIVIVLFAAAVPSHQLTPFAILAGVTALVVFGRCSARGLPWLMAVMLAAWITFLSAGYLAGHLSELSGNVGQVDTIAAANVGNRIRGSAQHQLVVQIRLAVTALLWGLAVLGWLRRRRHGQDDMTFTLLAVAPFPFLVLQPYGGELLLRVYFFALPFVAFLAAGLFLPVKGAAASWRATGAIGLAVVVLLGGFLFARYGNERMEHFTTEELAAVRHLYEIAPPGSLLLAATPDLPWKFQDYASYDYRTVASLKSTGTTTSGSVDLVKPVLGIMRQHQRPGAYFIITRSHRADAEARGIVPPDSLDRLEQVLRRSPTVQLVYANQDAQIYALRPEAVR